ncbi:TPA: DUF378 domain-containing protein [Candidatus Nomurabacteria bacterium]|nr:DUF378 domain-containing protein [Candidatus Nomurabacteria bacterium]
MKSLHMVAFVLLIIGGLNWGVSAAFGYNVVDMLLNSWPVVERLVYILIGLAALYELFSHRGMCKHCTA